MDPEERARRREERRRQREEDERAEAEEEERRKRREERRRQRDAGDAAETNGPTEENEEEQARRERREAGLSNSVEDDEQSRLAAEKERKRNAEIERQRLEDEERKKAEAEGTPASKPKKKLNLLGKVSKGRKKEILAMMLKKARGDLQLEEQEAAAEKAKYISENVKDSNVDSMQKEQLRQLCQALHDQLQVAEGEKFDLEIKVKRRDLQISNLKVKVNEQRGKFVMPTLKSVKKKDAQR